MVQSVFETGYIPAENKLYESTSGRTAFLSLSTESVTEYERLGFSGASSADLAANGFWRIIVLNVSEAHDEGVVTHNTMSDTVLNFATGAVPVGITVNGYLLTIPGKDDRVNFLKLYAEKLRGRALAKTKSVLYFGYKDTVYRLYITQLNLANSVQNETMVNISFTGVASHYGSLTPIQTSDTQASSADGQSSDQELVEWELIEPITFFSGA